MCDSIRFKGSIVSKETINVFFIGIGSGNNSQIRLVKPNLRLSFYYFKNVEKNVCYSVF